MPKVTDEYFMEIKNKIMKCTREILQDKPLYQITMRDIIKRGGFSQGAIYRYYSCLDEICLDLVNNATKDITIQEEMESILEQECDENQKMKLLFDELGRYIIKIQDRIGGKFYFELLASYAFDKEKQIDILPKLIFKQNLTTSQNKIVEYIMKKVEEGVFQPTIPLQSIISYTCVTIDGIANDYALSNYNSLSNKPLQLNPQELFKMLADNILKYLN